MRRSSLAIGLHVAMAMVVSTDALVSPSILRASGLPLSRCSTLYMAKAKKRGGLAFLAQEGGLAPSVPRKTTLKKPTKSSGSTSSAISPDLLQFMETKESASETSTTSEIASATKSMESDEQSSPTFVSFTDESPTSRRGKQSIRQQLDEERVAAVSGIVSQVESVIETGGPSMVANLLPLLGQIQDVSSSSSLKQLLGTKKRLDYRLAWVGSDAAVSHTGTGLHKVALARLQEVFLTLTGRKGRVQYTEVIRILGPFPNVKNTLQGSSSSSSVFVSSGDETETWKIEWDSMIDGTGKELLAGKAENTQTVLLNVCFSDEQVVLATLPGKSLRDDNGQHALLFIRETNIDEKLESLRVA